MPGVSAPKETSMPGRPRLYSDAAERQREYRARQQERRHTEQTSRERLRASLGELRAALEAAAQTGDPVAAAVLHPGSNELLLNLAAHFRQRAAGTPAEPAPAAARRSRSSQKDQKGA